MKVVIDIPDEWEKRIESNQRPDSMECAELVASVWRGKILPKGHGRLIDADELKETIGYYIQEAGWSKKHNESLEWCKDEFIDAEPTIIEAESEVE